MNHENDSFEEISFEEMLERTYNEKQQFISQDLQEESRRSVDWEQDIYEKLLDAPKLLSKEINIYDEESDSIQEDYSSAEDFIEKEYDLSEESNRSSLKSDLELAEKVYQDWQRKISDYKTAIKKEEDRMRCILGKAVSGGFGSLSDAIDALKDQTKERTGKGLAEDNQAVIAFCEEALRHRESVDSLIREMERKALAQKERTASEANARYEKDRKRSVEERDCSYRKNDRLQKIRKERVLDSFVERVETLVCPNLVQKEYESMRDEQPHYEQFVPRKMEDFPRGLQLGYVGYDITDHLSDENKNLLLTHRFSYAFYKANGHTYINMPYGLSFESSKFSTLFTFRGNNRDAVSKTLRDLALHLYMSIPVNRCWCTFIDPVMHGDTFAVFTPLGEKDKSGKGDERVIDTKIWFTPEDIEERLRLLTEHASEIIQNVLQGKYDNIIDYNMEAGINAEPLRFLMIMDFPRNFTDKALQSLESLLSNGPKTGIYTMIAADSAELKIARENPSINSIINKIQNKITTSDGIFYCEEKTVEGRMRYFPFKAPEKELYMDIIDTIRKEVGRSVVIPYRMISDNIPEKKEQWFHKSAREGISVPLALEGANKIIHLEFGNPYGTYAALIGGLTGIGKTKTLTAIIMGILFNYSPEDVQIYFIDFKEGLAARAFANMRLPNFRVISVETEPEFGLSVLKDLKEEMAYRGKEFKEAGVEELEDYWKYMGELGKSHNMPRLVIIFDEIQVLMKDESDPITNESGSIFKELVTKAAHAYGMHLILATQTFENVKGLDNGVYSNMNIRIAMNSDRESAGILLGSENSIVDRLQTFEAGQACINTRGGHKDFNRIARVGLIEDQDRNNWLEEIGEKQKEMLLTDRKTLRILMTSPEDDRIHPLTVFAKSGIRPVNDYNPAYRLFLGEGLTMVNTFLPELRNNRGQNILLIGSYLEGDVISRMFVGYSALSLLYEQIRLKGEITEPFITVIDLNGNTSRISNNYDMLQRIMEKVPEVFRIIEPSMLVDGIRDLYEELSTGRQQFVIFYGLNRAKQLTAGTYERSPKEMLEEMFAKGPELGMNFIVWANSPEMFLDNYARSLNSFDYRLAYGMEDKEYKAITGENGPENLNKMNVLSFNMTGDNQKIRIYDRPREGWIDSFLENVKCYIK